MSRTAKIERITNETSIVVTIAMDERTAPAVTTSLPFLDHMLNACAFHGGFGLQVTASGDIDVDPHHVVEDTGIVMGSCLRKILEAGPIARFGHAVIPMDEALSEATIDVCGRPTLVYTAKYPQDYSGEFPMWLFREFFSGLVMGANIALHAECRHGENSHHMVEALFKALGRAISQAYAPVSGSNVGGQMSTKGTL